MLLFGLEGEEVRPLLGATGEATGPPPDLLSENRPKVKGDRPRGDTWHAGPVSVCVGTFETVQDTRNATPLRVDTRSYWPPAPEALVGVAGERVD